MGIFFLVLICEKVTYTLHEVHKTQLWKKKLYLKKKRNPLSRIQRALENKHKCYSSHYSHKCSHPLHLKII